MQSIDEKHKIIVTVTEEQHLRFENNLAIKPEIRNKSFKSDDNIFQVKNLKSNRSSNRSSRSAK